MDNDGKPMIIIYHGLCSDGFCAAWIANKVYPKAEFFPATHGQKPPDVANKDVLIFDFAYKRDILLEMHKKANSLKLFDHHKTAAKCLEDLSFCEFDMTKSGATLAWDYFKLGKMPWIVKYIEDKDLGKWKLPYSKEINASLASYPFDFKIWNSLEKLYPDVMYSTLIQDGKTILRFQERLVEMAMVHAKEVVLDGHKTMAVNTSLIHGEVAERLSLKNPLGISWYKREDGKYVYSLRSVENGIDVSEIAKNHGGGGHPHCAGFESNQMVLQDASSR